MVINRRALGVLAGALLAGLIAVGLAMQWANRKISEGLVQVAVAGRNIDAGERLGPDNIRLVSWPRSSRVAGSADSAEALNGRVTSQAITAGEPILEQRLTASGVRPGLSAIISPGRRAMTVKVNEVIGVAGFALPGSYVDILVTLNHNGEPPISRIVLERIPVLAVAQEHTVKDESKPKVVSAVTLEVTPEQAERLDLARSVGALSMVLRNQTDKEPVLSRGALLADILRAPVSGGTQRIPSPRSETSAGRIEIIRGVQRSSVNQS
jgi:pilus assembly protein CpaB